MPVVQSEVAVPTDPRSTILLTPYLSKMTETKSSAMVEVYGTVQRPGEVELPNRICDGTLVGLRLNITHPQGWVKVRVRSTLFYIKRVGVTVVSSKV